MFIAISYALGVIGWQDTRPILSDFTGGGAVWLLVGMFLAFVLISALAMDAARVLHAPQRLRSRARRPVDFSESTNPELPGQATSVGAGTRI